MTAKIFVADDVSESGLGPLRSSGFDVEKRPGLAPAELQAALKDCEGLIVRSETKVTADLLDAANSLRVIGRAGVGVDNIDVAAATQRGIWVANVRDANWDEVSNHVLALLLAWARGLLAADRDVRAGGWSYRAIGERHRLAGHPRQRVCR